MGGGGRLEAFSYLTADKAPAYRAVMRIFLEAKERFLLHLRPADVQDALGGGSIELDGVPTLLTQLVEWGNLRADPDTAEVTTVEEFYRARFLYQLTPAGEAAERAVHRFEELLVTPGELQTTALADIRGLLRELVLLAGDDHLDDARVHLTLRLLVGRFEELTDRARTFIAGLQRSVELHGIDLDAFVAYKHRLIDYLERFIGDLVVAQAEIAQVLAEVEAGGVDRLLAAAADRDLADALEVTDADRAATAERWAVRWRGLASWFIAPAGGTAQADVLRARARQAIPALLQAVAQINERRISRADRPADLRTLARWFAQCASDAEAHRLWRAAFGLTPARHLKVDGEALDVRAAAPVPPDTSWADAEPLHISPQLRRTGRYPRTGKPLAVIDRSREKALLARQAAEEAAQLAEARQRLLTAGATRLSLLGELDQAAFGLFLDLLGEALANKLPPADSVRATSTDGSLEIVLVPTGDGTSATIVTSDGALHGPDHHVEIRDLHVPAEPVEGPSPPGPLRRGEAVRV